MPETKKTIDEMCPPCLEDLLRGAQCGNARAGVKAIMFGLRRDVKTWPAKKPPETRTRFEDHVITTTGDLEMKTGKYMYKFEAKPKTSELKYTLEGETGGKSLKASLESYYSAFFGNIHGAIAALKNEELVLLIKVGNNDWHLIGDEDEGAEVETFEAATGKNPTDSIGANFMFSMAGLEAATIYKGEVDQLLMEEEAGTKSAPAPAPQKIVVKD
jgi:hypothetical protein